jgi:capsular exopolysaccharide synthesis family protein
MEALQVSSQGETIKRLTDRLDEAQQKFADVAAHYGPNHPEHKKAATQVTEIQGQIQRARENIVQRVNVEYRDAVGRESMLDKAVAGAKAEFDRINSRSFQYQTLKREAEADKKLYEELITKIREAGINAGFQNSAIRIADRARPGAQPVFPNLKLNLLLALFCSTLLAVGAAVVGSVLDKAVRDPEQVARMLNTDVIGTLPKLKELRSGTSAAGDGRGDGALVLTRSPGRREVNGYEEAIRTLRNSILLADFDRRLRTLMITSAVPAEGKSTIATHLAIAHAQQGRSALLIDGDLRRPSVHRRLGVPNTVGLSNVLTGDIGWREARVRVAAVPRLEVLPAGSPSRRAGDLIGSELARLLEEAAKEYDLVILDSPPLLGFPEPMAMATAVDGVLMVVKTGQTNRNALGSALATLARLRANVVGIVMNEVRADSSEGYYYHYYGPNYYRRYGASEGAAS